MTWRGDRGIKCTFPWRNVTATCRWFVPAAFAVSCINTDAVFRWACREIIKGLNYSLRCSSSLHDVKCFLTVQLLQQTGWLKGFFLLYGVIYIDTVWNQICLMNCSVRFWLGYGFIRFQIIHFRLNKIQNCIVCLKKKGGGAVLVCCLLGDNEIWSRNFSCSLHI